MLKNIRPGRLRKLTRSQIELALERLFECPVRYFDGTVYAYCVDQYASTGRLLDDMSRLTNVGTVSVISDHVGVAVKIVFNDLALSIIAGADQPGNVETEKPEEDTIL